MTCCKTKTWWIDFNEFIKGKSQTHVPRKNTTRFIRVFQPSSGLATKTARREEVFFESMKEISYRLISHRPPQMKGRAVSVDSKFKFLTFPLSATDSFSKFQTTAWPFLVHTARVFVNDRLLSVTKYTVFSRVVIRYVGRGRDVTKPTNQLNFLILKKKFHSRYFLICRRIDMFLYKYICRLDFFYRHKMFFLNHSKWTYLH